MQFKVDFKDDKVVKKPRNVVDVFLRTFTSEPMHPIWDTKRLIRERRESVELVKSLDIDRKMLANTRFENGKIVQDKVSIFDEALEDPEKFGYEDGKEVIDASIDLRIKCWKKGFDETTFNYTINYGLYPDGKPALIDIGELTDSKKKIGEMIEEKKWLSQWSYFAHMPSDLKKYYKEQMNKRLTKEKLDEVFPE